MFTFTKEILNRKINFFAVIVNLQYVTSEGTQVIPVTTQRQSPVWLYSMKKMFLKLLQNLLENTCARVSFLIKLQVEAYNFIKKEALAQVFSCEYCEVFKNRFFMEHLWWRLLIKNDSSDHRRV